MSRNASIDRRQFLGGLSAAVAAAAMPKFVNAATASAPAKRLAGVFPIAFTPIKGQDEVNYDALAAQVNFCRRGGVHGLAWPQLASGWSVLSEKERLQGAEALMSAAKGGSTAIIIGVQSKGDFKETERYAKQAEKLGADGIICIPPEGVADPAELLSYYEKVGKLTALPFFAQAVGDFSVDLLVEMFHRIPTFRYVKDESGEPLERVLEIRKRTNDELKCFSGRGVATMMTEMERGFSGHCPYVSVADLYAAAYDSYHAGKTSLAFDQFGKIQAASSMFAQSDVNVLIARGVFPPGTTVRAAPPVPGAAPPRRIKASVEDIKHVLDTYLKADLRA
ncbi:MAG: dihydrodipicolinate synthase family protein [Povalibacter sp.]